LASDFVLLCLAMSVMVCVDSAVAIGHGCTVKLRARYAAVLLAAGGVGCGGLNLDEGQRLAAAGQIVAADGLTPVAALPVERYQLTFVVAGQSGDAEITRTFEQTAPGSAGAAIVTDSAGWFRIETEDLALSYDWQRDELICSDVCASWETVCEQMTEEVCSDICSEDRCGDECWDECSTECWDETYCDDDGCWTEPVCEDFCTVVCDVVCETVSYLCNCSLETHDVCDDVCGEVVEECDWETRTYTAYPALGEVVSTRADIRIRRDGDSEQVTIAGDPLEAFQYVGCDAAGECEPTNLWVQKDRFVLPEP